MGTIAQWLIIVAAILGGVARAPAADPSAPAVEFNGRLYGVSKSVVNGVERTTYNDGTHDYSPDELRVHLASESPRVLSAAAEQRAATLGAGDPIDVILTLREQPGAPIARAGWSAVSAQLHDLTDRMQAITRPYVIGGGGPQFHQHPSAAEQAARRALAEQFDDLTRATRRAIYGQMAAAVGPSQDAVAGAVTQLGGQVTGRIVSGNRLFVRLPAGQLAALAADGRIAAIDFDSPVAPELDLQRTSLGVDSTFWGNGIEGGVNDIGLLDSGADQSHPALSSHSFLSNMGTGDTLGHGTSVCGIMASTDTTYRGLAYGLDRIVVALASGTISISMTGMNYIISTGEPENTNYSYGNGTAILSDYSQTDQFFDGVIADYGFMVSKSAGNGGYPAGNPPPPTITNPAPAYNLMAVANVIDQNTIDRSDDWIDTSSSIGPTLGGRKKPDVSAPGTSTATTLLGGGFGDFAGTSSAAPHVGAGVILLWDLGVTNALACKAVIINTADAKNHNGTSLPPDDVWVAGSLWDKRYGWGYINLGHAYNHAFDHFIDSVPPAPEDADFKLYAGPVAPNAKTTLAWQRHVAYNGATFPTQIESLSDLDLRAFRESDNAPLAQSSSAIDNVEQFSIASAESSVVVKVEAFAAFDPDVPTETFALATPAGFTARSGPAFSTVAHGPSGVAPGTQFTLSVDVHNIGDLDAHGVSVNLSGVSIVSGDNPQALGSVADGGYATASWVVQADGTAGTYPLSFAIASNSYGEDFAGTGGTSYESVLCLPGDVNNDGYINGDDVQGFVQAFIAPESATPTAFCASDIVVTGSLLADDLASFVTLLLY
ncbi:MAG: S8 family serine peptidase [Phycisphaerae bacterium]